MADFYASECIFLLYIFKVEGCWDHKDNFAKLVKMLPIRQKSFKMMAPEVKLRVPIFYNIDPIFLFEQRPL